MKAITAKQRAHKVYDQYWSAVSRGPVTKHDELPDMRPLLEKAIIEAEEAKAKAERMAILQILDSVVPVTRENVDLLVLLQQRIRARSDS